MLFRILKTRFRQFGGFRVVRHYSKMGVLWPMVKRILRNPFSRRSYKEAYYDAVKKVGPILSERYAPLMLERADYYSKQNLEKYKSNKVWFCWLQGMKEAPRIILVCYKSLCRHLVDREIVVIDGKNWKEYVELPEYIIDRWEQKQIPPAHFSDLLRLQLLIRYGGTWIDSTVLCTGFTDQNIKYTKTYLDADLFMFQYTRPGSSQWGGISNWFISSCTNNVVLMVLRDMLFAYWKDYDCTLDYYIFHLFFSKLREVFPKEIAAMPYGYSMNSITLVHHWGEPFNQEKWKRLTSKVCFHKLAYSIKREVVKGGDNYYQHILRQYHEDIADN